MSIDLINPSPARQRVSAVEMSAPARWAIFFAVAAVCVAVIWLPFGFAMTGLIEEWQELSSFARLGPTFFVNMAHPMSDVLRPVGHLPFALAYLSGPDSFVTWHISLMLALVLKGVGSSELIYRAIKSLPVAIVAGILMVVYPADTMQFPFRALHINWSLTLALLACSICMAAWDRKSKALMGVAAALLLVSALMYEAALMCLAIPFLLVFVRAGIRSLAHSAVERIFLVAIWGLAAVAYVVYAIWMSQKVVTYQAMLLNGQGLIPSLLHSLPKLFSVGLVRALFTGWIDAFRMVAVEYQSYAYLIAVTALLGALVWMIDYKWPEKTVATRPISLVARIALGGAIAVALGYSPYLFSPAHVAVSQRTFLYAAFGAVLFWAGALLWIRFAARSLFWFVTSALIGLGLGAQFVQFHHYVNIAQIQRQVLRGIVENFDGARDKTLVVIDRSGYLGRPWTFLPTNLRFALEYFYGWRLKKLSICHAPDMEWQELDGTGHKGTCTETSDEWIFRATDASPIADWEVSKKDAVVLTVDTSGTVEPRLGLEEHRASLQTGADGLSRRYRAVLALDSTDFSAWIFGDGRAGSSYEGDFGRWWSMNSPIRGHGWRETEWDIVGTFLPTAYAWKVAADADLLFDMTPSDTGYVLRVKFSMFANEGIREALRLRLNGIDIECRWISRYECEALPRSGVLHAGTNEIQFSSPVDPSYYGLSFSLVSFNLTPIGMEKTRDLRN